MPDLNFAIVGAEAPTYAATPTLLFKLDISNTDDNEIIHSISLRCQIQIAVTKRHYSARAQARLLDVFGEPTRWGETLRNQLWTHTNVVVPQFSGNTLVDLPVPCTYDFNVVSAKYFDALEDGEIPLIFLFSGTIFYAGEQGQLQIEQVPWSKEATFQLPVSLWQEMIAHYYPNTAWIRMHKDIFDQLNAYKISHKLLTWDETLLQLLYSASKEIKP
ncbi:DUF6084 family protein [Ktedonospora formicarum]|uniref:Uncharacterized protein n=1 Tax=Ktedonospora formicarum TaxID=2778364 RepID=A0A8J3HV82_9CHLR|nr:DUF6084 family protein [Ktedonospora formicarum]GHO42586.1 hypothetical protein KSX_07490 [Ktedonospora formicarum]